MGAGPGKECSVEYNVPASRESPLHEATFAWTAPQGHNGELVYAVPHLHIGAVNISVSLNDQLVCTSLPRYGTEADVSGNEDGYLVGVAPCLAQPSGVHVRGGN